MQPNNQNPYQQGQNQSPSNTPAQVTGYAGTNVPDYLHLEPIADSKAPNRRTIIIVILAIVAITVICAISVFVWWKQGEASRILYGSMGKMLQTPVLVKNYNLSSERDKSVLSAVIKTKYSSGKDNESIMNYKYTQQYVVDNSPKIDSVEGDIVLNSTGNMAKLSQYPNSFSIGMYKINQWYQAAPEASAFWELYDPLSLINTSNTNSGLLPSGLYSDDKVNELISYLKSAEVYTVTKMDSTDKDFVYTVRTTDTKIAKFNIELSTILGLSKPDPNRTYTNTERIINISINKGDGRISKLSFEGSKDSLEILFSYPESSAIEMPSISNVIKVGV